MSPFLPHYAVITHISHRCAFPPKSDSSAQLFSSAVWRGRGPVASFNASGVVLTVRQHRTAIRDALLSSSLFHTSLCSGKIRTVCILADNSALCEFQHTTLCSHKIWTLYFITQLSALCVFYHTTVCVHTSSIVCVFYHTAVCSHKNHAVFTS